MSGVFDRFPELRLVLAEQGSGWIRDALDTMDDFYVPDRQRQRRRAAVRRAAAARAHARASTGRRNCAVAASFLHRDDCARRHRIGTDHIMWGSDYPHMEGTFPFSHEAMQMTFEGVPARRGRGDARRQRGADLRVRPRQARAACRGVRSVGRATSTPGLDRVPEGARSMAFYKTVVSNVLARTPPYAGRDVLVVAEQVVRVPLLLERLQPGELLGPERRSTRSAPSSPMKLR